MRLKNQYLYNVARQFIGELHIDDVGDRTGTQLAQWLYDTYRSQLIHRLKRWTPERLGGLVIYGQGHAGASRTSLYQVHCSGWLNTTASGEELLLQIAVTTIVAAITDLLSKQS